MADSDLTRVEELVGDLPNMTRRQAERMKTLIVDSDAREVLELGCGHGVSTAYIAVALSATNGSLVTIDLDAARQRKPNVEELLERVQQRERVTVHYEPTCYTWRLMKLLEEEPRPRFDLCYIDGAHSWFVDGLAFFLVDRLLKPGGWIVFDDLDWTFAGSSTLADRDDIRRMPDDERTQPQVRKIYELLVKPHPSYSNFRVEDGWALAQKLHDASSAAAATPIRVETIVQTKTVGVGEFLTRLSRSLRKRAKRRSR
jgi:predicted O-methyltransferase YrrM